jgi:T3SS negative regulator,GrlR
MTVKNGLYSIRIEMKNGGRGRATGVIVLLDGKILGGDTHFYYTGSYTFKNGKWRGELAQVTESGLSESSSGIRKVNRVSACEESTSIVPPCALAISLAM